jgi:hypothetical protein
MKADVPNAKIYYTTDGSMPNLNSSIYSKPIHVNSTTQIQAISQESTYSPSSVARGKYVVTNARSSEVVSPTPGKENP